MPQPVKFSAERCTDMPASNIFDGPITNLLLILCFFIQVLSGANAKGEKAEKALSFGSSVGCFQTGKHGSKRVNTDFISCQDHRLQWSDFDIVSRTPEVLF